MGKDGWYQLEIFYDPSIGYLPRMMRVIGQARDGDDATVKQLYLLNAQNVKSGGFVPAEWFEAFYRISSFQTKYPGYREGTKLDARAGDVSIGHFKATKIEDFKGPPKLDHLSKVTHLTGPGGAIVPLSPTPATLSLEEIRARFGRKLTNPKPSPAAIPHVDERELQGLVEEPSRITWAYLSLILAVCIPAIGFGIRGVRRRLASFALIAALTCGASGCGQHVPPVVKLSVAFTRSHIIYQPGFGRLTVPMVVTNEGNLPTRLPGANGGCSCREIDRSKLPVNLGPGRAISLDVTLHERKILEPQNIMISFDTDHGTLIGPAALAALPSQSLTPDAHSNVALIEEEGWSFELIHREIYDPSQIRPVTSLEIPKAATRAGHDRADASAVGCQ